MKVYKNILNIAIFILIYLVIKFLENLNKQIYYKCVFLSFGIIFDVIGIREYLKIRKDNMSYKLINGIVVQTKKENIGRGSSYFPVIEYTDEKTFETKIYQSNIGAAWSSYKVGSNIELRLCKRGEREAIYINSWFYIWGAVLIGLILGGIFTLIGIALILWSNN